jgi:hypothetical protein
LPIIIRASLLPMLPMLLLLLLLLQRSLVLFVK